MLWCCGDLHQEVIHILSLQCNYGVVWTDHKSSAVFCSMYTKNIMRWLRYSTTYLSRRKAVCAFHLNKLCVFNSIHFLFNMFSIKATCNKLVSDIICLMHYHIIGIVPSPDENDKRQKNNIQVYMQFNYIKNYIFYLILRTKRYIPPSCNVTQTFQVVTTFISALKLLSWTRLRRQNLFQTLYHHPDRWPCLVGTRVLCRM